MNKHSFPPLTITRRNLLIWPLAIFAILGGCQTEKRPKESEEELKDDPDQYERGGFPRR